jgi:hypothetical protein
MVSQETKEFFKFKNKFRINFFRNENVKQKFLEEMGIIEPSMVQTDGKMTYKHKVVNEKESS